MDEVEEMERRGDIALAYYRYVGDSRPTFEMTVLSRCNPRAFNCTEVVTVAYTIAYEGETRCSRFRYFPREERPGYTHTYIYTGIHTYIYIYWTGKFWIVRTTKLNPCRAYRVLVIECCTSVVKKNTILR